MKQIHHFVICGLLLAAPVSAVANEQDNAKNDVWKQRALAGFAPKPNYFADANKDRSDYGDFVLNKNSKLGVVEYDLNPEGLVTAIRVREQNPDPQVMASLVDLIATSAPVACVFRKMTIQERYDTKTVESASLRRLVDANKGKSVVWVRKIPTIVLKRYPGVFTEAELRSEQNFDSIAASTSPDQLLKLRKPWVDFFKSHRQVSKKEIMELADHLASH